MTDMVDVINRLYEEFGSYPCTNLAAATVECIDDGFVEELSARLCGHSLRSLEPAALLDYYYLAVDHIGGADELRHFLPRILEVLIEDPDGYLKPALLPRILALANAKHLASSQTAALQQFLECARGVLPSKIIAQSLDALR